MITTHGPEATEALGERLGARLRVGDVVALVGPMGAGKTVLARGIAHGAGARGYIASPSFVVIREYQGPVRVAHVDFFRIEKPDEVLHLGLDDLIEGEGIVLIEWADRVPGVLPPDHVLVQCAFGSAPMDRTMTVIVPATMADRLAGVEGA